MAQPLPELTNVLVSAQSPDAAVRQQAEQALEHLKQSQPAAYLAALAAELGGEQKPAEARQIAGLILKNALDAPSAVQKVKQWRKRGGRRRDDSLMIGKERRRRRERSMARRQRRRLVASAAASSNCSRSRLFPFLSLPLTTHQQAVLAAQWMNLPEEVKAQIRSTLLATLGSQVRDWSIFFFFFGDCFFFFLNFQCECRFFPLFCPSCWLSSFQLLDQEVHGRARKHR